MEKLGLLAVVLLLRSVLWAPAQSNDLLDRILVEERLSYASAAYLLAVATGKAPEDASPEQAMSRAEQAGFGYEGMGSGQPLTLGQYSYMLMRAFELPGGIMYRILPGPRYAAREMAYTRVIEGMAIPGMAVSGNEALRMLERMLHDMEESS
jgi:hypothetical protein